MMKNEMENTYYTMRGYIDQYGNLLNKAFFQRKEFTLPENMAIPFDAESVLDRIPVTIHVIVDKENRLG